MKNRPIGPDLTYILMHHIMNQHNQSQKSTMAAFKYFFFMKFSLPDLTRASYETISASNDSAKIANLPFIISNEEHNKQENKVCILMMYAYFCSGE
jgi:hypothetical protein